VPLSVLPDALISAQAETQAPVILNALNPNGKTLATRQLLAAWAPAFAHGSPGKLLANLRAARAFSRTSCPRRGAPKHPSPRMP